MTTLFQCEQPVLPKRGVHLDLKGVPPTAARLQELLRLFAAVRYNVVLVEWEDSFPWTVDERFRSPTAYTPDDVKRVVDTAADLGLELIPLVQCLGHMENPLSVPGYEQLRELPDNEAGLNPLAPGARELIQSMVDDVLALMPNVSHFHLGGDEARTFGQNPETEAYVKEHGKGALYLHHVEPILDALNERHIRPILWHDMMIDWDDDALTALAKKCDLMPWGYRGHPDTTDGHFKTEYIQRFSDHGFTLWGATAYKGAEGYDADVPDIPLHVENAQAWAEVGQRFGFKGVVATAWSRYAVDTIQCNPIDSSLDSMVSVAVVLHDARPPAGGIDACIEALAEWGEKERFEACRQAMEKLADLRKRGWQWVQPASQVAVLGTMQPHRTGALNPKLGLHAMANLERVVGQADEVADEVRRAFDGLMEPIWIEEYLATRITPLRDQLTYLKAKVASRPGTSSKVDEAKGLFHGKDKLNCAQAVLKAFQAECNVAEETIVSAKAWGGGRTDGGVCGALYAARMLLDNPDVVQELEQAFEAQASSLCCKPIRKQQKLSCRDCVGLAAQFVDEATCGNRE